MFKKTLIVTALVFSFALAPIAFADTASDLQAQINAILAQIKVLQSAINAQSGNIPSLGITPIPATGGGGGGAAWCHTWTTNLRVGSSNDDVSALQYVLQQEGFLSTSGDDKGTFGESTASAVTGFQEKYRGEILTPNGLKYGTGFVGASTRAKLNKLYGCGTIPIRCSLYSQPICKDSEKIISGGFDQNGCALPGKCVFTNQPSITILSPNGGESWLKGTTQTIRWQDYTPEPACISTNSSVVMACNRVARTYDIFLVGGYCPAGSVCAAFTPSYTIAKNAPNSNYNWNVGSVVDGSITEDSYYVRVCQSGTSTCDSSDSYFKIYSGTSNNQPPVISGLTAPTTLNVNQTGTWTVNASDQENGPLSYSVNWGEVTTNGIISSPATNSFTQTSTFTHSYSSDGTYAVRFTVTDNAGLTAQTSSTVQVGVQTPPPIITVLSPNGGSYGARDSMDISWQSTGLNSSTLTLYLERKLSTDLQYWNIGTIATGLAFNGSYHWPLTGGTIEYGTSDYNYSSGTSYRLMISEPGQRGTEKLSESVPFTITAPTQ